MTQCHDLHLLPPILVKNSLPVEIEVTVGENSARFWEKLKKQEERHYSFYNESHSRFTIYVRLEGFEPQPVVLEFSEQNLEKSIKLKHSSNNRSLYIQAHFGSTRAGCDLTFYSKTCILNTTGM